MHRILVLLVVFLHCTNGEPPNLLLHGAEYLRRVEMAMKVSSIVVKMIEILVKMLLTKSQLLI